jgi:hypothetical protein
LFFPVRPPSPFASGAGGADEAIPVVNAWRAAHQQRHWRVVTGEERQQQQQALGRGCYKRLQRFVALLLPVDEQSVLGVDESEVDVIEDNNNNNRILMMM